MNTCAQNYKFAGMERDAETGNDHTWYRQYASNLGRWLSPDPVAGSALNPQSLNRYAYVLNNPTNLIDPLGLGDPPPKRMVCDPWDTECKHPHPPGCTTMGCVWQYYRNTICFIGGHMGPCPVNQSYFNIGTTNQGYDIFDAMMGAPGTYLTLDIYGNVGFGFSDKLWSQTWGFIDYERSQGKDAPTLGYGPLMVFNPQQSAASATRGENVAALAGTDFLLKIYGEAFRMPGSVNTYTWPTSIGVIPGPSGEILVQTQIVDKTGLMTPTVWTFPANPWSPPGPTNPWTPPGP